MGVIPKSRHMARSSPAPNSFFRVLERGRCPIEPNPSMASFAEAGLVLETKTAAPGPAAAASAGTRFLSHLEYRTHLCEWLSLAGTEVTVTPRHTGLFQRLEDVLVTTFSNNISPPRNDLPDPPPATFTLAYYHTYREQWCRGPKLHPEWHPPRRQQTQSPGRCPPAKNARPNPN